jgi:hypothetical protein
MTPVANLALLLTTLAKLVASLLPVSLIPVVHLDLLISPRISKKFETVLMGYSGAGGKLIYKKKPEAKNLVTLSL